MLKYNCEYCVPPKRYSGCHDHCPEYLKVKAEKEAQKKKRSEIDDYEWAKRAEAIRRKQNRPVRHGGWKK